MEKTETIIVRVKKEVKDRLIQIANETESTLSQLIRIIFRDYLKK